MSLSILSEVPVADEAATLPVTISGAAPAIPARISLRSGDSVAYGSFALAPGFAASLVADRHLFVLVIGGRLAVRDATGELYASAGEAFVLPQGARADWASPEGASAIFSSCADPAAPSAAGFLSLPLDTRRDASPPYAKEMLLAGEPQQSGKRLFADSTGRWLVGVWDSGPYHRKPIPFPRNELMYLHCGAASFTRPDGTVAAGDRNTPFVVAKGFVADWHSRVYVFKTYCADTM